MKCCPNVLHHVASQRWSWCCSLIVMVLIDFNGYLQGQKGPVWTYAIYWGQYLRNGACCDQCLYAAHTQRHIWSLSWPCDLYLGIPLKVKSMSQTFQEVVSHKWCILWSSYEIHIVSHIWPFSLPYNIWPSMKLKGQIKVVGFSAGYISETKHVLAIVY